MNIKALPALLAGLLASTAIAIPAAAAQDRQNSDHHNRAHESSDDAIVVVGHPPTDFGLLSGSTMIEGDDLVAQTRGQIGDILTRLPGVSATSFAPGASRPVLRGFDGDRIRVLVDGIGAIDASNTSADHAVVLDPLTTDHIDVVHGPAVLLFGGQAIGGAVNALDKRIPRAVPQNIGGTAIGSYGSAGEERAVAAMVEVPLAERLALHVDGNWRKSGDVRIGGLAFSGPLRAELLAEADELRDDGQTEEADELQELAGTAGRLPNSAARSYTLGAGLAFIDADGDLGVSVQHYDTRYGVPGRPGAGHHHEEHGEGAELAEVAEVAEHGDVPVSIDLVQTRIDFRGSVVMGGLFDRLQVRGAYGDYRHTEFEGDEVGTRFTARGHEFRVDLTQKKRGGWRGRSGLQLQARKLDVVGAEAFVPGNQTDRVGVFTLQSLELPGGFGAELAGRFERASVKASSVGFDRSFDLWSGAAGLSYVPAENWKLGINYIRGARAPAPEELLSNGPHIATQSFEIGDPTFGKELSNGFEAYVRFEGRNASMAMTVYMTDFDGFISARPTSEEQDALPVFRYAQLDARFQGFEASGNWTALRFASGLIRLEATADYTRARLKGVGPVPRIPPLRLRGGIELETGDLHLHAEAEWNDRQDRVDSFENSVKSFTFVNLSADWHPLGEDGPLTLLASANNIFDVNARRAASFTRDFAPLAGRDIRLTAKVTF